MKKVILISAGHTNVRGLDRGAEGSGCIEGVEAVFLRDAVAADLREKIKESGFEIGVIEDGFDGENDPLKKAIELARTADIAIEFHFNAGAASATGIEVLAKPKNKVLAQKIAYAIHAATDLKLRGDAGFKTDDSGQHHRLGFVEAGGVIVEVCFISSREDMKTYHFYFDALVRNISDFLLSAH